MYKVIAIGMASLIATLILTTFVVQIMIACYNLDINLPINKEMFILLVAGEFAFFYHWILKLSK